MSQSELAALEKSKAELEVLASRIDAHADILREVETKVAYLKIIEGRIKVKSESLKEVESKLAHLHTTFSDKKEAYEADGAKLNRQLTLKQTELAALEQKVTMIEQALKTKKDDLATLHTSVKERQQYLTNQEQTVNQTIEDWNLQLHSFQLKAAEMQSERLEHTGAIKMLEQRQLEAELEAEDTENKLVNLNGRYETKSTEYRQQLQQLQLSILAAQTKLESETKAYQQRLSDLEVRERSVQINEQNLTKKADELVMRERKLKSDYALYGVPYS